jgi:hypothetical protein
MVLELRGLQMKNKLFALFAMLSLVSFYFSPTTTYADFNNRGYRGGRGGRPGAVRPGPTFHGHSIGHPVFFRPGPRPVGGWRGVRYIYEGRPYFIWSWGPWAPFYTWPYYTGWRFGLYYYIPDGLLCYADNNQVEGIWTGQQSYYLSDDAINAALSFCETDPRVIDAQAQPYCRIRNCQQF